MANFEGKKEKIFFICNDDYSNQILSILFGNIENDIIIEMIEVFVNSILYLREVYPSAIFRRRKMYNTAIFVSIYPRLNDYITKSLKTAYQLKQQNKLQRVELIIFKLNETTNESKALEKYVFEVDSGHDLTKKNGTKERSLNDQYLIEFEDSVRTALIQLDQMVKKLKSIKCNDGEDISFKIDLLTTETAFAELIHKMNATSDVSAIECKKISLMTFIYLFQNDSWIRCSDDENISTRLSKKILPIFKTNLVNIHAIVNSSVVS